MKTKDNQLKRLLKILGPGFISGAADNDPAGIATYTQVGAEFGYGQLWTAVFAFPLLAAVQEACARVGAVTGKGLAQVIKENYSRKILYAAVLVLLVANTINIGADIGAIAEAAQLIFPIPFTILVLAATFLTLFLEIRTSYKVYARYLKWLSFMSFSYLLAILLIRLPWTEVVQATFLPHIEVSFAFLLIATGNIGTTIAPYLFFWEASEEVEEDRRQGIVKQGKVNIRPSLVKKLRLDNFFGMFISQLITWSIIVVSAAVLHAQGITDLKTAADAAKALEPLVQTFPNAGFLAKLLFSIGIVSAGFLVVPVLSGSAGYAIAETLNWREGLNRKFHRAHGFYGVIILATIVGLISNFVGIDAIKLLIYTSVLNGVVAIPLIFLIGKVSSNQNIMGEYRSGRLSKILIATAFAVMALVVFGAAAAFLNK